MSTAFKKSKKIIITLILCLCVAACTIGTVLAFLTDITDTITNEFIPAKVTCSVEETFENGVKEDVKVKNTGNINAYIRSAVVVTFVSDDGKILATSPTEGINYHITFANSDWEKGADGFWYYKTPVAPDEVTTPLIKTASAINAPDGYRLNVQILASAIQSEPHTAVEEAWGVTVINKELHP